MERSQNDAAPKHSETRKAAILDSALDYMITIDHEGCIMKFNPAAERTFRHNREDVMGRQPGNTIITSSLRERHRFSLARYLVTGEARVTGQPVGMTVTRIASDGPPSFTGYLRDITDHTTSRSRMLSKSTKRPSGDDSPFDRQHIQQRWNGDDLFGLLCNLDPPEHHALPGGEGGNHADRGLASLPPIRRLLRTPSAVAPARTSLMPDKRSDMV